MRHGWHGLDSASTLLQQVRAAPRAAHPRAPRAGGPRAAPRDC
eukprot:SAG31_NODE_1502_length_8080_cov_131.725849_5_plen_43_part_00